MRCYDGCPDSSYQALLDSCAAARATIIKLGYTVTYFPMEERYMAFKDFRPASAFFVTVQLLAAYLIAVEES